MALSRNQKFFIALLLVVLVYLYTRRQSSMGPSDLDQRSPTDMKNMKVTQMNHVDNPVLGTVGAPF